MHASPVDPRDRTWEDDEPVSRVLIWSRPDSSQALVSPAQGWVCQSDDVSGADIDEVLAWAKERTPPDGTHAVFVRAGNDGAPGLIRLAGWDPTRTDAAPPRVR